jgi:hypothetical protein
LYIRWPRSFYLTILKRKMHPVCSRNNKNNYSIAKIRIRLSYCVRLPLNARQKYNFFSYVRNIHARSHAFKIIIVAIMILSYTRALNVLRSCTLDAPLPPRTISINHNMLFLLHCVLVCTYDTRTTYPQFIIFQYGGFIFKIILIFYQTSAIVYNLNRFINTTNHLYHLSERIHLEPYTYIKILTPL